MLAIMVAGLVLIGVAVMAWASRRYTREVLLAGVRVLEKCVTVTVSDQGIVQHYYLAVEVGGRPRRVRIGRANWARVHTGARYDLGVAPSGHYIATVAPYVEPLPADLEDTPELRIELRHRRLGLAGR